MGTDAVSIDLGGAAAVVRACRDAQSRARSESTNVRRALAQSEQGSSVGALIEEIADEMGLLAEYLELLTDEARLADSFGPYLSDSLLQQLTDSLDDDRGASRDEVAFGMDFEGWDIESAFVQMSAHDWVHSVYPPGCVGFGANFYAGGGAIVGPDGREYPIVVPRYRADGELYTADAGLPAGESAGSLGGADPGWILVGYDTGTLQLTKDTGAGDAALYTAGAGLGAQMPTIRPTDHLLSGVMFLPGQRPVYVPSTNASTSTEASLDPALASIPHLTGRSLIVVDGQLRIIDNSSIPDTNRATRRTADRVGVDDSRARTANAVAGVVDLAANAYSGMQFVKGLNGSNEAAYEVMFEQNIDGRVRVRITSVGLRDFGDGPTPVAEHLFVNQETGELSRMSASYFDHDVVLPGGSSVAVEYADPEWWGPVVDPAIVPAATGGS